MVGIENELPADAIDAERAAQVLRGSRSLVYRLIKRGQLRGWRVAGTRIMVSEADVRGLISVVRPDLPGGMADRERQCSEAVAWLRKQGYRV